MSTPNGAYRAVEPARPPRSPLRLRTTGYHDKAHLDGGWWPQSRDLSVELADLVDHFPPRLGRIVRALFSPPDWDPAPLRVPVTGGSVQVGSFPHGNTHLIHVRTDDRHLLRLLVVPSSVGPDQADDVLMVAARGRADSAFVLLGAVTGGPANDPWEHWNDDGGTWWEPHPASPSLWSPAVP